jgi:hypothetical protein
MIELWIYNQNGQPILGTPKVEKSNFYNDLEGLLNLDVSAKKSKKQNENEEKQKRE